jgi:hypothetical protein
MVGWFHGGPRKRAGSERGGPRAGCGAQADAGNAAKAASLKGYTETKIKEKHSARREAFVASQAGPGVRDVVLQENLSSGPLGPTGATINVGDLGYRVNIHRGRKMLNIDARNPKAVTVLNALSSGDLQPSSPHPEIEQPDQSPPLELCDISGRSRLLRYISRLMPLRRPKPQGPRSADD